MACMLVRASDNVIEADVHMHSGCSECVLPSRDALIAASMKHVAKVDRGQPHLVASWTSNGLVALDRFECTQLCIYPESGREGAVREQ